MFVLDTLSIDGRFISDSKKGEFGCVEGGGGGAATVLTTAGAEPDARPPMRTRPSVEFIGGGCCPNAEVGG